MRLCVCTLIALVAPIMFEPELCTWVWNGAAGVAILPLGRD